MDFKLPRLMNEGVALFCAMVDEIVEVPEGLPALAATTIINGRLTLYLSPKWHEWHELVQREVLSHECGHIVLEHHTRRCQREHDHHHPGEEGCERDNQIWGLAIDGVLHHDKMFADYDLIDEASGGKSVTFERLGLPPCKAEIAYEMLLNNQAKNVKVISCGSGLLSRIDGSVKTQDVMDRIGIEVAPHVAVGAGVRSGPPMPITGTIPPPPPWIQKVIPLLIESVNRANRGKSWRRFSRTDLDLLPGRELHTQLDAQVFIDQSGSCDQFVPMFLSAICSTPELAGTRVYTFDDQVRGPLPASDFEGVRKMLEASRGGTLIAKAGKERENGCPVVWLTDAESGDGLPKPHQGIEVWAVIGDAPTPGRTRIKVEVN